MSVIGITSFVFLMDFDKNFFVHPRLDGCLRFVIPFEFEAFSVILIEGNFLIILHEKARYLKGAVLHPLDIEIDFGAQLVLRGPIVRRRVGIGVVDRTPVTAGDDDPLSSLLLEVVE